MATVFPITGHGYTLDGIAGPFYPFYVECHFPGDKDAELTYSSTDSPCSKFCYMTS